MDVDLSEFRCNNVTRYLLVRASCLVGLLLVLCDPVIAQDFASQEFFAQISAPRSHSRSVNAIPAAVRFDSPLADDDDDAAVISTQTIESVKASIETVQKDTAIDPVVRDRLLLTLNQTLEQLKQRSSDADRLAGIAKQLADAPEATRRARALVDTPPTPMQPPANIDRVSIEKVRESRSEAEASSNAARQLQQSLDSTFRDRQTRRELLPKLIQEARKALSDLESTSIGDVEDDPSGRLKVARENERRARIAAIKQRIELLVQEQALIEAEAELLPLKQTLAKLELAEADGRSQWWSAALRARRESQIEDALAQHREMLKRDGISMDASVVLASSEHWTGTVVEIESIERKLVSNKSRCDELSEMLQTTRSEIERDLAVGGSLRAGLGLKLQLQRNKLPTAQSLKDEVGNADQSIEDARALLTQVELTLDDNVGVSLHGFTIGETSTLPMKDGVAYEPEVQLLKRYASDLDQYITKLVELKGLYDQKREIVDELRLEIDSHVMWIRNANRFGLADIRMAWLTLRWILHPTNVSALGSKFVEGAFRRVDRVAMILAAILFLAAFASRFRKRMSEFGKQASAKTANSLKPTWASLAITIVLSMPLPVALWAVGGILAAVADREAIVVAFSAAFMFAAAVVFPLELLRQSLRPGGLAIAHFGVAESPVLPLRQGLRVLIDLGLPLVILWGVCQSLGRTQVNASLGRLLFVAGMLLIVLLIWQAFHPKRGLLSGYMRRNQNGWLSRLSSTWFFGVVATPLCLAGLSLLGYSYGASQLVERLYWTLWLVLVTCLASGLLRRWLLMQRRRLAWAVRREKLEQSDRMEGAVFELAIDDSMQASEINAQTSRLVQAAVLITAIAGVYLVWSPVFPAIRYLESFELWDSKLADGTREPVTLANLVLAIPIIVLAWISVRNLPGLIEGVLLERLPLEKAVRYAITSLASYAMMAIGILFTAKTLGLRWESIQWLVAALGVGLGFGLQEIFANFISGLILLFEQPIRIGDVVTLGDTTGVVSRIRIRATTVTNWDRQELIIPNKDLITGRLINWTLSDSTNRILVNVGVAYGTDTRVACRLLETICDDHPQVAKDPKPVVTFDGFGDSTLNLVVRCFLTTLDVRLQTIHELHTDINERFSKAGIEIAFPQRDLHLRSLPPELLALIGQERKAA